MMDILNLMLKFYNDLIKNNYEFSGLLYFKIDEVPVGTLTRPNFSFM